MEEKYQIVGSFGDGKALIKMNDGSGYSIMYRNGRVSSARFEKITEFDMHGFAMAYRYGDEEPSLMVNRKGDIFQLTKVVDNKTRIADKMEREINAKDAEREIEDKVRKNGRVRIF